MALLRMSATRAWADFIIFPLANQNFTDIYYISQLMTYMRLIDSRHVIFHLSALGI